MDVISTIAWPLLMLVWAVGLVVSILYFVMSITNRRKNKGTVRPIIISGISSFVLSLPVIYVLLVLYILSTGTGHM